MVRNKFLFMFCFVFMSAVHAQCHHHAVQCKTLVDVRKNIDVIDAKIIGLIGKRLSYVKRAGEIKGNVIPVHDQARENKILAHVRMLAARSGYSPEIAVAIYKTILQQSNSYERHYGDFSRKMTTEN